MILRSFLETARDLQQGLPKPCRCREPSGGPHASTNEDHEETTQMKTTIGGIAAAVLLAATGFAQAATVSCPPTPLPAGLDRQVTVTGAALSGGLCWYAEGNIDSNAAFNNPAQTLTVGSLTLNLLAKDSTSDTSDPNVSFTTGAGGFTGTFSFNSTYLTSQDRLFVGFHFGNGGGSPDSFVVELDKATASNIAWTFSDTNSNRPNALSNLYVFGTPGRAVPEPATLGLLGLGLLGAGVARRRKA
jgi:hypothetical protein